MNISTLLKQLIFNSFLCLSFVTFAQESITLKNQDALLTPGISEEEIAVYFPDKYPVKRWENLKPEKNFYQSPFQVSLFSPQSGEDSTRLWSQTKSIFAYGFGVVGVIALLPEDISSWNKEDGLFSKWSDNVKDGPVWDRDTGSLNLIGHPYFGGIYYQVARKSGYRQWDSFMYSALMSTFYWEYGIEGFAETPSIQDLVITPVLGWVYGEWAFTTEMSIRANNDEVLGSSILGSTALILLDPVDSLSVGLNRLFGKEIIKAGTSYISINDSVPVDLNGTKESQIQFNISLQLGDGRNYNPNKTKRVTKIKDPIDTGIVGISYGIGNFSLDEHWHINDDSVSEYSLGLYFSKKFSTRLSYSKATFEQLISGVGKTVAFENYSVDSQYYFNTEENFRPYITAGFGEMVWEKDNELKTFQLNLGTGIHYKITKNLALQLDWRHYYSTSTKTSEDNIASRIIYRFGDGER
jgi:hypothetical protein